MNSRLMFIFNGIDKIGAALGVANDADLFGNGNNVDALLLFTGIENNAVVDGVTGDKLFVGILSGPSNAWDTTSLPTDYSFLSLLTTRSSLVSLEVPGGGDANDVLLGTGSFAVTQVPEPASLTLTALGLACVIARARRGRQRR